MLVTTDELLDAVQRLYNYMIKQHWNGQAVVGPDPGIRFNARFGRFIKNYLKFFPWPDNYVYLQAQGYWIINNWLMAKLFDNDAYSDVARNCSRYVLSIQQTEGYWEYPNPEWKKRIATVEGCFGALGLLESYNQTRCEHFLIGAKQWYHYMVNKVGFQNVGDGMLAINYFSNLEGTKVPNNSTLALQFLAKLAYATGDDQFLATSDGMVAWLNHVQLDTGELPYAVGQPGEVDRPHFLCYQYNAFELLDLLDYYHLTDDKAIWSVIERLVSFLSNGLTETGTARYDCSHTTPEVTYYTTVVAQALSQATNLGIENYSSLVNTAYRRVLSLQKADGSFNFHSRANFIFLSDQRSYPRYLSMILNHLLREYQIRTTPLNLNTQEDISLNIKQQSTLKTD